MGRRLAREAGTLKLIVGIYCAGIHSVGGTLCSDCQELLEYAMQKLGQCPYQEAKPTCAWCKIHCYAPHMREKVKAIMLYSGPRMLLSHPSLTLFHLADTIRSKLANRRRRS